MSGRGNPFGLPIRGKIPDRSPRDFCHGLLTLRRFLMSRPLLKTGSIISTTLEKLEPRRLLSASPQINYLGFATTHGLVLNGYGSAPTTSGSGQLILTDGAPDEARSVYFNTAQGIQTFQTEFTFNIGAGPTTADGFTFILQNVGLGATGLSGRGLGSKGLGHSFAMSFDLYNYDANKFGSDFRFLVNGVSTDSVAPIAMSPINLHSGQTMGASISYDGTTVTVKITDLAHRTSFTTSEAINLPALLGGYTAFAGFTAATGASVSNQEIGDWTYTGTAPFLAKPTVQIKAAASPSLVTGPSLGTDLSVLGESADGNYSVTYNWTTLQAPAGAKPVVFSDNGENAAQNITVQFFEEGTYVFQCAIVDINGQSIWSDVQVNVE
jgi:hypothetical protein